MACTEEMAQRGMSRAITCVHHFQVVSHNKGIDIFVCLDTHSAKAVGIATRVTTVLCIVATVHVYSIIMRVHGCAIKCYTLVRVHVIHIYICSYIVIPCVLLQPEFLSSSCTMKMFVCMLYFLSLCVDGWFLLGTSALTGNVWDGGLSIFSGYEDYLQCPNLSMVACNTPSGVNDAVWCVHVHTCT